MHNGPPRGDECAFEHPIPSPYLPQAASRAEGERGAHAPGRVANRRTPPHRIRTVATWILTGSLENFRINVERGFDLIGFKERRRRQAAEFEPGDEIVFYVIGVQAFGGIARVGSEMFEDRTPVWPQGRKKHPEAYPWRVEAEPVIVLSEQAFVPAESLIDDLEHVRKWPPDHWHLAFQGQLRTVSEADADLLRERIEAASRTAAPAV
jgi:predicted RNA-binding protein